MQHFSLGAENNVKLQGNLCYKFIDISGKQCCHLMNDEDGMKIQTLCKELIVIKINVVEVKLGS